jgi:hypothetical protein
MAAVATAMAVTVLESDLMIVYLSAKQHGNLLSLPFPAGALV